MASSNLGQELQSCAQWQAQLRRNIEDYRAWLETQGLMLPDVQARIDSALAGLDRDHLAIEERKTSTAQVQNRLELLGEPLHIQQTLLDGIERDISQLIEGQRGRVAQQISQVKRQLRDMEELRDKSEGVIQHLLEETRGEQAQYLTGVSRFQTSRAELQREAKQLRTLLDLKKIDALIKASYDEMLHRKTTYGIKLSIKFLIDELQRATQAIMTHAEHDRKTLGEVYQWFQNDLSFPPKPPPKLAIMEYQVALEHLYREMDAFRRSPALFVAAQGFVINRLYRVLAPRVCAIFEQIDQALDDWLAHALDPLVNQIQGYKETMEKRLANLQKIGRSKDTLQTRIADMESQHAELARQLTALRNMHKRIHPSRH